MTLHPLEVLEPSLMRNRGAGFEGDIFSILRHSPYIVRSAEFALVDGAIDCTRQYAHEEGYAARLWVAQHLPPPDQSDLLLWDAKSSAADDVGR